MSKRVNAADGYLGDWASHKPTCRCADCQLDMAQTEIAALRERLARLDWRPITETDLPKVGDEVLAAQGIVDTVTDHPATSMKWIGWNYTHFRPINAPERKEEQ